MAKTTRNLVAGLVVLAALGLGRAEAAETPEVATMAPAPVSRVRADNPAIKALILEATRRSATFRGLVDTIDATNGIVFIQQGRCGHGVRACLALTVTMAGPSRLLRVVLDMKKADRDLIASIGHELRHAVEVLSDETVTSDGAIFMLYKRIGSTSGDRFETNAAIDAGRRVWREARAVSVLLSNGQRLQGSVRVYRPEGRDRLSDWARRGQRFRYIETNDATFIVNIDHIVSLRETV